jgi:hypothetical protein
MNYSNKRDNLRNEIPFQNMVINPNNLFQFGPMPNIVFVDTNFLNKKRGQEEIQSNDNIQSRDNSKCKYFILINIIYFFWKIFLSLSQKNISTNKKIYNIKKFISIRTY